MVKMSSLGFAQITNDAEATIRLIQAYDEYFDKFFITIADTKKDEYFKFKKFADNYTKKPIKYKYFKWVKSFGKARIANQKLITTDYWFWMDTDDDVDHPELLRPAVQKMEQEGLEVMFFNYNYYRNPHGEGQADHWRERIVKTNSQAKWADAPCHETVDVSNVRCERTKDISVLHNKTVQDMEKTVDRNYELLINDWEMGKDPRTAYYLGMTMMTKGNYKEAVEYFLFLIEHGGWDEQKLTAWCAITDCYTFSNQYDKALVATNMAMHIDPSHPDPYYQKVILYTMTSDYSKAVEWASIAMTKQPNPDSMQLTDPTKYSYKGQFLAAQAYLFSGRIKEGFDLFNKVRTTAPHFIGEMNRETKMDWNKLFEEALYDNNAIEYTRYLSHYFQDYGGDAQKLFEALPKKIYSDVRLNAERVQVFPPKKWKPKSIAYYCGPSVAPWGPDMLKDGVGGSEEAVIYLSRELTKLGWKVTVFGDREEEYCDTVFRNGAEIGGIWYKPWTELNPWDEFDVFVASRQPQNVKNIKARLRILDMHDVNQADSVYAIRDEVDKIFVKSKWHRECYPEIPDEKFVIVGNGILMEQFNDDLDDVTRELGFDPEVLKQKAKDLK